MNKKTKIFFIMSTDDYSGAEAVNFAIIEKLKNKYDFYWVSKKGKINHFLKKNKIKWIEINKLSVKEIKRIVKDNKPDILHATDYRASFICSIAKGKTKLICHLHNNPPWIKKRCINSVALLYAGLKSNVILTVSDSIKNEYIFSRKLNSKIICVDNPISRERILKNISQVSNKKIYDICCVARITEQKNPYKFLNILCELKKKNKNIKSVWVGAGDLYNKVTDKVQELDLNKNIDFVGFKENPYNLMNESRIFVLTSDWEGFGLVAYEALTLGLPCIVSNVGGLPKLVDNTCGKLCVEENDFIESIDELLSNNKLYKIKSGGAIKKSKELDNYNEYINKIVNIYKSL